MTRNAGLALFLPPVARWFQAALGTPTPVQLQGWPSIQQGNHTLLLAPTGSGKTLAAFLACLDQLWRQPKLERGVRILYISPLKALNNDIYRNLQIPLDGVAEVAEAMGQPLPRIDVGLRTGDTPFAERARLVRKPPHVLITTPESLHLLLTSRARDTLQGLTHCIVDEIHALCPNKRGVFLSLLLERLQALNPRGFVRIGLSATQRPLEEVARFLGGQEGDGSPRPVQIIDAGLRKKLDLEVLSPVEHFGAMPEKTIWPSIERRLAELIRTHRSTIIFANNRRTVERLTARLNEQLADDDFAARAHHGSVSLEVRQETEAALKEGRLRAVVATASLELGIDMGSVDLVCQVESPGNVSRGLQRVGRAGHLVGQHSKGRLIPKTTADLLDQAVLAREMMLGHVECLVVPANCLDVLAQQVVAMVGMEDWSVDDLLKLVRRAYPFRDLTAVAFDAVLEMVTGRFRLSAPSEADKKLNPSTQLAAFQPRISWDRVHHKLLALPGSQRLALTSGGVIPDTGQYAVIGPNGLRLGELDEEFVYERRVGDVFLLGTSSWRIDRIEVDRVLVKPAEGHAALPPFWRGERTGRSVDLGIAQGEFLETLSARLDDPDCVAWLRKEHHLDQAAAQNLRDYVRRQMLRTGNVPTHRRLHVEASRDPLGDWQLLILSPLGYRIHFGLRLAVENLLRQRLGYRPQCLHHDDGIVIRLTDSDEPILDPLQGLTPENLETLILEELADSALFALRFRQNAARALMMPRGQQGKRAPLWLQRLRGRDLLQVARRHPDFPLIAETFRECLHDHLDVDSLRQLVADVGTGRVTVSAHRLDAPSPFASTLLFNFTAGFMYVYDGVESKPSNATANLDRSLLEQIVGNHRITLEPTAIARVERRLRRVGLPPRSSAEMAEWLRRVGDLAPSELEGSMLEHLESLQGEGRATLFSFANAREPRRWILSEEAELYGRVFGPESGQHQAEAAQILRRFLDTHALVGLAEIVARYPFDADWARRQLEAWAGSGRLIEVRRAEAPEPLQWSAPENYEQMERGSLAVLRQEIVTGSAQQFADFVVRWQYLHPNLRRKGSDALAEVVDRLEGVTLPTPLWEQVILPARMAESPGRGLDALTSAGQWSWVGAGAIDRVELGFWQRETLMELRSPRSDEAVDPVSEKVIHALLTRGALFLPDLALATELTPSQVRRGLWELVARGLITNDQFDVARRGPGRLEETPEPVRSASVRGMLRPRHPRPRSSLTPEGRWSLVSWGQPEPEAEAYFLARLLLRRYGIVARELAALDGRMPAWRVMYEVLSRLELAGEVRRGYFVEGLSGAQFALPEAVSLFQSLAAPSQSAEPVLLLHSLDPANLFGSGAPFDLPLSRRAGCWLTLRAGRPLLLVEQHGRKLTALPTAGPDDLAESVKALPRVLATTGDHKLVVESWNDTPVSTSPGREMLEAAGFVRDYQAMTLYSSLRR